MPLDFSDLTQKSTPNPTPSSGGLDFSDLTGNRPAGQTTKAQPAASLDFSDLTGTRPLTAQPSSAAPAHAYQDPSKSWYERAFDWANTPITTSLFGWPEERPGAGGFERGIEHIAAGVTAPLSLALMAGTFGTGGFLSSAGETALKEAVVEGGGRAFTDEAIGQIAKGSKAALEAFHGAPSSEPVIQEALTAGGHDLGLLQRAREAIGPVNLDAELGSKEVQAHLAQAGFDETELKALAKTSDTIKAAQESFNPVRAAVEKAGVDYDTYKRGIDYLDKRGLDHAALLGGDAIDRGAFQILHKVAPDLSLGTTLTAARTAKTLMNTGFTLQQLEGAAAMSPRFFDALKEGDYDKAAEYGTEWAANTLFGVAGASHALHSWGELAEPILGSKFKPSDEQLKVNKAAGVREAEHAVGDQQGINVYKEMIRSLGYDPDKVMGLSKTEKLKLADELVGLHLAIESGKDPGFAAAYRDVLHRALGVEAERPVNGQLARHNPDEWSALENEVHGLVGDKALRDVTSEDIRTAGGSEDLAKRWGSYLERPKPASLSDAELAPMIRAQVLPGTADQNSAMFLNHHGHDAVVRAIALTNEKPIDRGWKGFFVDASGLENIAKGLDRLHQFTGEDNYRLLAEQMRQLAAKGEHTILARRDVDIFNTATHEQVHGWQERNPLPAEKLGDVTSSPEYKAAQATFANRGYDVSSPDLPREVLAHFSEGDYLGLSKDRSVRLAKLILSKYTKEQIESLPTNNPRVLQAIEELGHDTAANRRAASGVFEQAQGAFRLGSEGSPAGGKETGAAPGGEDVRGQVDGLAGRERRHEDGELLDYRRVKEIFRATLHPEAAKDAIGQAYGITGGNKWITWKELDKIGRSALEKYPDPKSPLYAREKPAVRGLFGDTEEETEKKLTPEPPHIGEQITSARKILSGLGDKPSYLKFKSALRDQLGKKYSDHVKSLRFIGPDSIGNRVVYQGEDALKKVFETAKQDRIAGAPPQVVNDKSYEVLIQNLMDMARTGAGSRFWYDESARDFLNMAGGDRLEAHRMAVLSALYSPRTSVMDNGRRAIHAYYDAMQNRAISAPGVHPDIKAMAEAIGKAKTHEELSAVMRGMKTSAFQNNLINLFDPEHANDDMATIDIHMMRALGYTKDAPNSAQYDWAENAVRDVAQRMGWKSPKEAQAAVWVAQKMSRGMAEEKARVGYGDSANKIAGSVNVEGTPGASIRSKIFPGISKATRPQLEQYHADKMSVVKKALQEAGVLLTGEDLGHGYWEGESNPVTSFKIPLPHIGKVTDHELSPAATAEVERAAKIVLATVGDQDSVGWNRPFPAKNVREQNASHFALNRELNYDEMLALNKRLEASKLPAFIDASDPKNLKVINYDWKGTVRPENGQSLFGAEPETVSDKESARLAKVYHDKIRAIITHALPDDIQAAESRYYAQSELVSGEENGQGVSEGGVASGSSPLQAGAIARGRQQIEALNDYYKRRFGWGTEDPNDRGEDVEPPKKYIDAVHYSDNPNLTELDPKFHGQNMHNEANGQPMNRPDIHRKMAYPDYWHDETYLGRDDSPEFREKGAERFGARSTKYTAKIDSSTIYDMIKDPDHVKDSARAELEAASKEKYGVKMPPSQQEVDAYAIHKLKDMGYSGRTDIHGLLAMWDKVPVEKDSTPPALDVRMTPEERSRYREVHDSRTANNTEQTVGTAAGAKADTDFFAQAKAELKTDDISAIARRAQELKEAARPVNGLFSKEPERENLAPTWYLKSNQLIDSRMSGPMPADTALKMLENNGVKPDELKYTGLSDFLKEKGKEPVRPEELRSYLAANNLQIQEVTKGGGKMYEDFEEPRATKFSTYTLPGANPNSYRELLMTLPEGAGPKPSTEIREETPGRFLAYANGEYVGSYADRNRAQRMAEKFRSAHWDELNTVGHVRFNDRTGPKGEKLLHLEELQSDWHQKGRKEGYKPSNEEARAASEATKTYAPSVRKAVSEAGIEPNGPDHRSLVDSVNYRLRSDKTLDQAWFLETGTKLNPELAADVQKYFDASKILDSESRRVGVPDAPFKKTWPEFLFKRMVRYAAENGYDGISWTPGEEQAARYDLSKQISEVHYSGSNLKAYDRSGSTVLDQTGVSPDALPDIIGKEAAQKLMAQEPKGTLRSLVGQDLKVGGEGMKGFYDKIVPELANKLGKQFGAKVGETKITTAKGFPEGYILYGSDGVGGPHFATKEEAVAFAKDHPEYEGGYIKKNSGTPEQGKSVPYFPLTDSLRESVLKQGQPLFSRERPVNGLPENLEDMLQDNQFAKRSPEYQQKILKWFEMIAQNRLPENVQKAYKYAVGEDGKNWEIAHANGMMEHFIDNHVHRKYLKNEQGNVVVSDAKAGKFATNTTAARRRAYDTLMTALLKSPDEIKFDPAEAISKDRAEITKAAANRKFISQLMSSGLRASDGRPVAFLSGAGNVVAGQNGEDPKIFVDPNRVRKINISDATIAQLAQSGDLQRFLDDGTIRDITPYIHPDNMGAAIDRLEKEANRKLGSGGQYDAEGNNKLLEQVRQLKQMQESRDFSGLRAMNEAQPKAYAWSPQGYVALDHSAMRGWNFVTNTPEGGSVLVNSDILAHPEYAQYLKNRLGLEQGALSKSPVGKAILKAGQTAKETLLSLSPFHLVQLGLRGIMTGVNPFTLEAPDIENGARINPEDPNSPTKIRKMVEHGLTTGRDYKSMHEYTEGVASGDHSMLRRVPVVGPILAETMQHQTDFLFKRYLPAIKAVAAEKLFDDYKAQYPEWSTDKIARAAAAHANDTFGGVNWRAMGRNATTQEMARAVLLAPDWLESELRSGARLFNKDEGAIGRRQIAIMAGSVYLMARVLNAITTGNPHYEAPFDLATKSKDGKETLWGIRMLPSDLLHAASSPAQFIKGRLSPGVGLGTELLTGRDKMGRKMQPQDLWADATRQLLPIPVQSLGQAITNTGPEVGNAGQAWKAIGGTARSYSTPAQQKAVELAANHNEDGFVDQAQQARHRVIMHLEDKLRSGDVSWPDLVKMTYSTDELKEAELKKIQNNYKVTQGLPADIAHLYTRASRLPAKEFLDVWDTSNITERKALQPLLLQTQKKYLRKATKDMTPAERQADPVFQRFLNMAINPTQQ